jgi:hypothetical protein
VTRLYFFLPFLIMAHANKKTSPAMKEFCVWADCNRRVYQHVVATGPDAAYRIAKENPEGWECCFGHEDNGYRLSNDVQDVETGENFAVGSATHCKTCGVAHSRKKPWNGEPADLCPSCEQARIDELQRLATHHEDHPDECCCATYLGRECCMAPIHGDVYRALSIENGDRVCVDFRAKTLKEAKKLAQEYASTWGGEYVRVRKLRPRRAS